MMVSKILFIWDRILIGLKLFIFVCTPFLCIGRTLAIFKKLGYSPLLIDRLNILFALGEDEEFGDKFLLGKFRLIDINHIN